MKYKLVELNLKMGKKEYEMYQDIPSKENGQTNLCNGLSFDAFTNFIESQVARKYQNISLYDTPTVIYILYVDDIPVGEIGLRTKIDDNWKRWSGNFYYKIRKSDRNKGYGNIILKLGLKELKRMGFSKVYGQASKDNIASNKVMLKNGGVLNKQEANTNYYGFNI